jgi:hypothetical protein
MLHGALIWRIAMTDLEARIARILFDEDESTARQVTMIVTEIAHQVRTAKEEQLADICRRLKHDFGASEVADQLWDQRVEKKEGAK